MRPEGEAAGESAAASSRRVHPFFRDVSITLVASACVALGGLLLARVLAIETGAEGFASYSLVKQTVNGLFPIVTIGLVGGLPRYLALPREEDDPSPEAYLASAFAICGLAVTAAAGAALVVPSITAAVFFGDSDATRYVLPFVLLLSATTLFYVAYGYFRGLLRLRAGSLLQVLGMAVLPPALVALLPEEPVHRLITYMALGTAVLSLLAIMRPLTDALRAGHRALQPLGRRRLWNYGRRRVPGEVAQLALFVLVPILAAHVGSLTDVAYLSAGQQILSIVSLSVLPLGLVLLPSLTKMWASDRERVAEYVAQLSAFAATVAIFATFQAVLYADIAVRVWLGPEFEQATSVVRVVVAPAGMFVLYLMLRSTLDAVEVKSYNSRNNLIAIGVFAAVAGVTLGFDLGRPVMGVASAFAAGVTTQGVLTFATVHRFFNIEWSAYGLQYALPMGLLTALIGFVLRPVVDRSEATLLLLLVVQAALAVLYLGAIVRSPMRWPRLLAARFFAR